MTIHTRPPVEIKRKPLNKAEMLALFIAQEGRCGCGLCDREKLMPGEIDEQHDPPHDLRKNDPNYDGKPNILVRRECHKLLTKSKDLPIIKKARHQGGGKGSQLAKRENKSYRPIPQPSKEQRREQYRRQKAWKEAQKGKDTHG